MPLANTSEHYGAVAKSFHWLMAVLVIGMLAMGFKMVGLPLTQKLQIYGWHKSTGATLLILAALRICWRLANTVPSLPLHMKRMERFGAHASHFVLYALLFCMPMTGWLMSSAAGFPVSVFGLFHLPDLILPDPHRFALFRQLHGWLAWGLIITISVHALAALFHQAYYHDTVLKRMLP